jgi:hypothetical protein
MLDAIRRILRHRQKVRADAEALMQELPGYAGWRLARERGLDDSRSEGERQHWWRVAGVIESRTGIRRDSGGLVPPGGGVRSAWSERSARRGAARRRSTPSAPGGESCRHGAGPGGA